MKQHHILVAEDDPVNAEILDIYLKKHGYEVTVAKNGVKALDLCLEQKVPFDLIVLDIQMPELSGFDVLKLLRENSATKETPIICYSASATQSSISTGMLLGCSLYITKPARPAQILAEVQKLLADS